MHRDLLPLALVGLFPCASPTPVMAADAPCDEVRYSEPRLVSLTDRITIARRPFSSARRDDGASPARSSPSPLGTAAFLQVEIADRTRPGPRANAVDVFASARAETGWRIAFDEVHDDVELRWVNEELLFIRAWWSRAVSTELIFELGSGRFIYAREASHVASLSPCRTPAPRGE